MKFADLDQLNNATELFFDPQRSEQENRGPHLLVVDDFYSDPQAIRRLALTQDFYQYSPPLASQVGADRAAAYGQNGPRWCSTSLQRWHGQPVACAHDGYRYNGCQVKQQLSGLLDEQIVAATWSSLGDGWNGAFHLQFTGPPAFQWSIHHHYKEGDVYPRGWSGLVYLSPNAPSAAGTSLWRDRVSGKCIAVAGTVFSKDTAQFEKVFTVENRFNRLVLFRENVLHRAEQPFGQRRETARLTQTFFFLSNRPAAAL